MGLLEAGIYKLAQGPNFAVVTTNNADGSVQAQPLWVHCDEDHLLINTELHRHRMRNVERDDHMTVCVISADSWMHWGEVRGTVVETITGPEARQSIDDLAMKYTGHPYANPIQSERVLLKIRPDRQIFTDWT